MKLNILKRALWIGAVLGATLVIWGIVVGLPHNSAKSSRVITLGRSSMQSLRDIVYGLIPRPQRFSDIS